MAKSEPLELLKAAARSLSEELDRVNRAIAVLEEGSGDAAPAPRRRGRKPGPKPKAVKVTEGRRRRTMTAEQRQAVSARMKHYWEGRRAAKSDAAAGDAAAGDAAASDE